MKIKNFEDFENESEFTLIVSDNNDKSISTDILITAWEPDGYMSDYGVVEENESLEKLGIVDLMEGHMEYHGNLSKQELVDKLISMGFDAKVK